MLPLILSLILETGWLPTGKIYTYQPFDYYIIPEMTFYGEATFRAELYGVFIDVSARNVIIKSIDSYGFMPNEASYVFRAGWQGGPLELGFRHYCIHPIATNFGRSMGELNFEGGYEEVYARLKLEWKPFDKQ